MHKTGRTDGTERDGRTHRTDGGDGWTVRMAGTDVNGRTGRADGQDRLEEDGADCTSTDGRDGLDMGRQVATQISSN
jgi:hypothetical protein